LEVAFGRVAELFDLSDADLEAVVWNLEPIVDSQGEDGARQLLRQAQARADALTKEFAGLVAHLEIDALVAVVSELTEIRELLWRASGYGRMRGYADSSDALAGALRGAAETAQAEIDAKLLFFELEWVALDDDRVEALLASAGDRLDFAAHHLRRMRARRPYLLSHEQERILAETSVQRLWAWKRLYSENAARLIAEIDGDSVPIAQAMRPWRLSLSERWPVCRSGSLPTTRCWVRRRSMIACAAIRPGCQRAI
jgi:oligoendopeptidase F